MRRGLLAALLLTLLAATPSAPAQDALPTPPDEVKRLIDAGQPEALEARFTGIRSPLQLHWIAQAWRNKAARTKDDTQRDQHFAEAERRYRTWIAALERSVLADLAVRVVNLAAARVELGDMIAALWAVPDLDEFEVSAGKRGDRKRLAQLLGLAREEFQRAREGLDPLTRDLARREEELLALGIYDRVRQLKANADFQFAWTNLFFALAETPDAAAWNDAVRSADETFRKLLEAGASGATLRQCRLGLGIALREQRRFDDAERELREALPDESDLALFAHVSYELARLHLRQGKFREARNALKALVERDVQKLTGTDRAATYHINLCKLWDAYSHLLESDALKQQAAGSTARVAILNQARDARVEGLSKLTRLAEQAGPWPGIVRVYIAGALDLAADPKTLTITELLLTARELADARHFTDAAARLREAAARADLDAKSATRVLWELGELQLRTDDNRGAAESFARLAAEHRSDARAPEAALRAYQLWARVATETNDRRDFEQLAAVLLNLVQSYPDHPQRLDALWWLPVALQEAGKHAEAAEQFAKIPSDSPRFEEAQFRRILCERIDAEKRRATQPAPAYLARQMQLADRAVSVARQLLTRETAAGRADAVRKWSAESLLQAADIYLGAGVEKFEKALDVVADFERRFPASELIGRALAVRIRAYRGLRQFDHATNAVQQYLASAPPEQSGPVLALVANGVQEELERLRGEGRNDDARKLAEDALPTFQQLLKWCEADPKRTAQADLVSYSLARLLQIADQPEPALEITTRLLNKDPQNGNYQRLRALILTSRLPTDAPAQSLSDALDAWAALLRDPDLRTAAPEGYWEARFYSLHLLLRQGKADDVKKAIEQERIWQPTLGGSPWRERLEALLSEANDQAGKAAKKSPP